MTDREDIDMLAAEYVLGTLDHDERSSVAVRRLREPALEAAIQSWEQRLMPLSEHVEDTQPRADFFDAIQTRIGLQANEPAALQGIAADHAAPAEVVQLRRRASRWRTLALAATAAAATMAGIFIYNGAIFPVSKQQYVAVFNQGDAQPKFLLSIDLKTREVTIRQVGAEAHADKSYELWIVSDRIKLRSLGLLAAGSEPTRKRLEAFDPALLQGATFGISLEPKGGSPIGKPTGPALHGKLVPANI